ncbi:hypothetical protein [Nonlabens xiamenensis]|uniref:hypothetical protein n=1 Tax=Nonlabens xiamenensis TaxID=2341043 RepID=UPI000F60CAEA|nr:hypothetical protein [Nonlabens xiamenensis]
MYQNTSDKALLDLLEKHQRLTFESQLSLLNSLKNRSISCDTSALKESISNKKDKIKELFYLKNLGFQYEYLTDDAVKVSRTGWSIFTDACAIFFGLVLCFISIYGIFALINTFQADADISVFQILVNGGLIALGVLGIQFLSGANRLIDYIGFEILSINNEVTLRKRLDLKRIEKQADVSDIQFDNDGSVMGISIGGTEVITVPSGTLIHELTLRELVKKLQHPSGN